MNKNHSVVFMILLFTIFGLGELSAYGNCLDFDGSNDYVNCGTYSALRQSNYITLECWVYVNSVGSWEGVVTYLEDSGGNENGYGFFFYNGYLTWWLQRLGGTTDSYSSYPHTTLSTNTWTHIAGTYNSSTGMMYLYKNGALVDSYSKGAGTIRWETIPNFFTIGAYKDDDENYYFDGRIDDVRLWSDDLTATEIQDRMYGELPSTGGNLIGYWKMNETSGSYVHNEYSYTYTGSMVNMDSSSDWVTSYAPVGQFSTFTGLHPESLWNYLGTSWTSNNYGMEMQDYSTASISATEFYSYGCSSSTGTATTYLPSDVDLRSAREWFLDDNANDAINVRFDISDFGSDLYDSELAASNYKLMRRTSTSSTYSVVASGSSISGDLVYFNGYTPSGDAFYSLGRDNNPATVVTNSVSSVGETSASVSCQVTADGGGAVTSRGIAYSSSTSSPTISNSTVVNGSGTGSYTCSMSSLEPNTTYYVRAFATNSEGTSYGTALNFTTIPDQPSHVFPENNATGLPRQVTIDWRWEGNGAPTGFRVYQGATQIGSDILWSGDIVYTKQLAQAAWGEVVSWHVVAYNATGVTTGYASWSFTVADEPVGDEEYPASVVYTEMTDVTDPDPAPITLPVINLGAGNVQPTFDFSFGSVPNIPILGCQVTDLPMHPVAELQNCGAAFNATFPAGITTTLTFTFGTTFTPDQLYRWNSDRWEDISAFATFGVGSVTFDYSATSRGEEEFIVDNGGGTLPVELSAFSATVTSENFAMLKWTTQSENDMAGYNILRGSTDDIQLAKGINNALVPAENSTSETSYEFVDNDVIEDNQYYYWLECIDLSGSVSLYGPTTVTITQDEEPDDTPDASFATAIQAIYPNPFNPSTRLSYTLSEPMHVNVTVYDLRGRKVRTLVYGSGQKGMNEAIWDGTDASGKTAASGIYLFKLEAGGAVMTSKALMLK